MIVPYDQLLTIQEQSPNYFTSTSEIEIYTDGGCRGNGKETSLGSWAVVILYQNQSMTVVRKPFVGTTNNIMELYSVIYALGRVKDISNVNISVISDSEYVTESINLGRLKKWQSNGWKTSSGDVKNQLLWKELNEFIKSKKIEFIHVDGHSGHKWNELCDKLVNQAMDDWDGLVAKYKEQNKDTVKSNQDPAVEYLDCFIEKVVKGLQIQPWISPKGFEAVEKFIHDERDKYVVERRKE
jgi:ribonuclease HI